MFVKENFEARDLSINSHLLLPVLFLMKFLIDKLSVIAFKNSLDTCCLTTNTL